MVRNAKKEYVTILAYDAQYRICLFAVVATSKWNHDDDDYYDNYGYD
jgi:hypothetical protein